MNGDTLITWNVSNWLTIAIMGLTTFMLVGLLGGSIGKALNSAPMEPSP